MTAPLLLGSIYNSGDSIGPVLASIFGLLMGIEMIYVFVKYVITSKY